MNPDNLIFVAAAVFSLMLVGIVLTVIEFRSGAPKEQVEDKEKLQGSPHGHVD